MKHFTYIIAVILTFTLFTSCGQSPERTLKKIVAENYEPHGFTNFEEYRTVRLCDEVLEQKAVFKWKMNWDISFYDAYLETIKNDSLPMTPSEDYIRFKYDFYKKEIEKDKEMLVYLESIDEIYPDKFNEVSFTTYRITYLAENKDGDIIHDRCYGKFNTAGELVSYRMTDSASWTTIRDNTSIPGYRELLLQ